MWALLAVIFWTITIAIAAVLFLKFFALLALFILFGPIFIAGVADDQFGNDNLYAPGLLLLPVWWLVLYNLAV